MGFIKKLAVLSQHFRSRGKSVRCQEEQKLIAKNIIAVHRAESLKCTDCQRVVGIVERMDGTRGWLLTGVRFSG